MDTNSRNEASEPVFLSKSNSNSIFKIPSHLLESYGPVLPSEATLRVDDSGKKWRVSIEKFKDSYLFTSGWKQFAEQVDLKSLDFLLFKSGSSSKTKGTNKYKTRETKSIQNRNKEKRSCVETTSSFIKETKIFNRYKLDMPRSIALSMGLRRDDKIKLQNREGREYIVNVGQRRGTFTMTGGWYDFVIDNKVMVGSKISFAWLSGKTLQVEIMKMGNANQPLYCIANTREKRLKGRF